MSAIFGRIERDRRPVDAERFAARAGLLKSYGPDTADARVGEGYALAEFGLTVAPRQLNRPLASQGDKFVIIADAVLDGRDELLAALNLPTDVASALSDRDLISAAYLRWGPSCVERLFGDFAFAAFDPQSRLLVLARDHIGARPLYYAIRGETVLFSTSIEALVSCAEFDWPIHETAIVRNLSNPSNRHPGTFFAHIESVPAGGLVMIDGSSVRIRKWWAPAAHTSLRLKRPEDYISACRSILDRAIANRTQATGPVGAHCSGGLDSTGVTVLAHRALKVCGSSLAAAYLWAPELSAEYADMGHKDERRRMGALSAREGFVLRNGGGSGSNLLAFLERPMELEGQADLADELPILRHAVSDDIKIMLSGWGADEAFSAHGYGHLAYLTLNGQWARARQFGLNQTRTLRKPKILARLVWDQILYPLLPNPLYKALSPFRNYYPNHCFLAPDLARRHADVIAEHRAPMRFNSDPSANLNRHFQAGHITMRMESWAAWAAPYGFQYRYPLTDRRLVEFMLSIPPEAVFLHDRPRGLALAALDGVIPDYIGKDDPANQKLRANAMAAAWRGLADQVRAGRFDRDCPWLDMAAFRRCARFPEPMSKLRSFMTFAELFSATRVYGVFTRQNPG